MAAVNLRVDVTHTAHVGLARRRLENRPPVALAGFAETRIGGEADDAGARWNAQYGMGRGRERRMRAPNEVDWRGSDVGDFVADLDQRRTARERNGLLRTHRADRPEGREPSDQIAAVALRRARVPAHRAQLTQV